MYRILDSTDGIQSQFQHWPDAGSLMCDCEFVRERTYWPQLGLLQLGVDQQALLIDPTGLDRECAPLKERLQGSLIVMHAPGEDLECLRHRFGWLPRQLFDTQLAAAYAGFGSGLGYRALVQQFCGIELDKGETRSDWLARPLSESQLRYAAEDVLHLPKVFETLQTRLEQLGFRAWFDEDCQDALRRAEESYNQIDIQLEAKSCYRLDAMSIARWRKILHWREVEGRLRDRPKGWILDNEATRQLAQSRPGERAAHDKVIASARRASRSAAEALWQALDGVQPNTEDTRLEAAGNAKQDRQQLKRLQDAVAAEAESLQLPAGLLMSRKKLEALLDRGAWPEDIGGWRRQQLQPVLLPLLNDAG
ncbi:ribonuclease D [Pseudomarimonas arenosa]|uniref:Ribonuclease D n=1 Tax=Pseudomarimonas arenosa TaxID=2774145 RepID=A0AAW3ZMB4_9GAMM|nr:ribonuclease D [Pseudomarimonas arenosa]MBD8526314.1 ribonuclease D [Pseudomarimonas arenosa]